MFRNELREHYDEEETDDETSEDDDPVADDPTEDDEPTADDPAPDDPSADDPAADDPTADDPASDDPVADDPTADDPAPDDPIADDPTADDPAPDDVTDDEATPTPEAGTGPEPEMDIAPCVLQIMQTSCTGLVCHYNSAVNLPPDFERDNLFGLLTTETPTCADANVNYVDLENPEQSFILQKVLGQQPTNCGTAMPPSGSPQLTTEQLDCLEGWFASLAQ